MRIYAYLALALILSALLYGAIHVWRKAERVDVAEAALVTERKSHDADLAKVLADLKASEASRVKLASDMQSIIDRFNQPPPNPKTLIREVKVPNEPCPGIRVSADLVSLWNNASSP